MSKPSTAEWLKRVKFEAIKNEVMALDGGEQNRAAALQVLESFRNGNPDEPLHPDLFDWLFQAFGQIVDGTDAVEALQLKRFRGERKTTELATDPVSIALFVALKKQEGVKQAEARRLAEKYFSVADRTVANACRAVDIIPFTEVDQPRLWAYIHSQRQSRAAISKRIKK